MAYAGAKRKRGSTPKRGAKRTFKRRRMAPTRAGAFAKRVKAVVLKTSETKCYARFGTVGTGGGVNLNNNTVVVVSNNLMGLTRGPNEDALTSRIGDEIFARGVRITFTYRAFGLFPDQYLRWYIVRNNRGTVVSPLPFKTMAAPAGANIMIDCVDTEKVKIIKSGTFRTHGDNETNSLNASDKTIYKKIWVPFKNLRIRYQGDDAVPWPFEYTLYVGVFYGANLGTSVPVGALVTQVGFYFKDP